MPIIVRHGVGNQIRGRAGRNLPFALGDEISQAIDSGITGLDNKAGSHPLQQTQDCRQPTQSKQVGGYTIRWDQL